MFDTRVIADMDQAELVLEYQRTHEYVDKVVALGSTLKACYEASQALAIIYAGQKGHEIYLMALDVVAQSTEKRLAAVAGRVSTLMSYIDNICELLEVEPDQYEEWPAYEIVVGEEK